jgi:hypothetical protein
MFSRTQFNWHRFVVMVSTPVGEGQLHFGDVGSELFE